MAARPASPTFSGQELYSGLIRLHILHHANQHAVYGLWIIDELARHGYRLSAGTLYPLLHRLERRGLLRSARQRAGRRFRRVYAITPAGRKALRDARAKVQELFEELFETRTQSPLSRPMRAARPRLSGAATNRAPRGPVRRRIPISKPKRRSQR